MRATAAPKKQQAATTDPHFEHEESILSALIVGGQEAARALSTEIDVRLFTSTVNRAILQAIVELHAQDAPIELLSVTQHLRDSGTLESVGGAFAITQLYSGTKYSGTVQTARYSLGVLHEAWIKREAHGIAIRAAAQSKNGTEPDELLGTAIEELQTLRRTMLSSSGKTRPIEFRSPAQLRSYKINPELVLAGDFHIMRNDWFVIGGAPCVGKSRAAVALAVAGATGGTWFNLPIHRQFKTMIVQNENAQHRLSTELRDIECQELDDRLLISLQPEGGINFANKNFRAALRDDIAAFKPDVVILDPWNAVTKDEKAESYLSSFQDIRSVIPPGENSPAVGIVAHTRKPRADERTSGRGLLNLLAGSYVLGSVPRTVFAIQAASDDPEDARVVWTCCKNNNGPLGARSAWFRLSGLFAPCEDFDWEAFEHPEKGRAGISRADVREIFNGGKTSLPRNDAAKKLQEASGFSRSTCYNALELDGRFSGNLVLKKGDLSWRD